MDLGGQSSRELRRYAGQAEYQYAYVGLGMRISCAYRRPPRQDARVRPLCRIPANM